METQFQSTLIQYITSSQSDIPVIAEAWAARKSHVIFMVRVRSVAVFAV
jgi:hypothetical protein